MAKPSAPWYQRLLGAIPPMSDRFFALWLVSMILLVGIAFGLLLAVLRMPAARPLGVELLPPLPVAALHTTVTDLVWQVQQLEARVRLLEHHDATPAGKEHP